MCLEAKFVAMDVVYKRQLQRVNFRVALFMSLIFCILLNLLPKFIYNANNIFGI